MSAYQVPQGLGKEEVRATLDVLAREGAQRMLVSALEQEIADYLGRARYDHGPRRRRGYRNGVGKFRKIAVDCGTLEVRPPRAGY